MQDGELAAPPSPATDGPRDAEPAGPPSSLAAPPAPWRRRAQAAAARLDRVSVATVAWIPRLVPPCVYAGCLGVILWALSHVGSWSELTHNKLTREERWVSLALFVGSLLAMAVFYAAAYLAALRRRTPAPPPAAIGAAAGADKSPEIPTASAGDDSPAAESAAGDEADAPTAALGPPPAPRPRWDPELLATTVVRLNWALTALLAGPLAIAMTATNLEMDRPFFSLALAVLASAACVPTLVALTPLVIRVKQRLGRATTWLAVATAAAAAALYGVTFSWLAVINHRALQTRTIDLGLYDNLFFQTLQGRPLGCSFLDSGSHITNHFDPILVLLAPLYLLYPQAELLLVLQSLWLAAGCLPAYLIGRRFVGSHAAGAALAVIWALHPAIHGANMYEFHSLTLIAPLLLWLLYCLDSAHLRAYAVVLGLLFLCREDIPLITTFVGVYAILSGRARVGWLTILASAIYFAIAAAIMASYGKAASYAYYYAELIPNKLGVGDFVISLLTNPAYALSIMVSDHKMVFALVLLLPLGFLPLVVAKARVMLIYGALFLLLASRDPVYRIGFQYPVVFVPIAFFVAALAVPQVSAALRRRLHRRGIALDAPFIGHVVLTTLVILSLLVSWKFGGLVENARFRGGFRPVVREHNATHTRRYHWLQEMLAKIPADAAVIASDGLGAHISNRARAYRIWTREPGDFLLVDERELKGAHLTTHRARIKAGKLRELGREGTLALFAIEPPGTPL